MVSPMRNAERHWQEKSEMEIAYDMNHKHELRL